MKHYEVRGYEEGSSVKGFRRQFNSLARLQDYVKERWEGVDYIDGPAEWHTDYVAYELVNCTLADLGRRKGVRGEDGWWDWEWKVL